MSFLDHVISKGDIAVDLSKMDAMLRWETLKSVLSYHAKSFQLCIPLGLYC